MSKSHPVQDHHVTVVTAVTKAAGPILKASVIFTSPFTALPCGSSHCILTAVCFGTLPLATVSLALALPGGNLQRSSDGAPHSGSAVDTLVLKLDRTLAIAQPVPAAPIPPQPVGVAAAFPPANHANSHLANAPNISSAETLLLEVRVNGMALHEIARVDRLVDGRFVLPLSVWAATRLKPPETGPITMSDDQRGYAVQDVSGLG